MNILIGDDHLLIREGVEQIIMTLPDIESIDEASNGLELLHKINSNKYDMVILDMALPGFSSLDILKKMRRNKNKANVLIYSFEYKSHQPMFALRNGASGFLSNNCVYDELTKAIRQIRRGGKYFSTESA